MLPSAQGPFGRPVDAGVGVVAVELEQPAGQRSPARQTAVSSAPYFPRARISARRIDVSGSKRMVLHLLGGARSPAADRIRRCGGIRRQTIPGLGTQRLQPVDDEAAEPRVGAVLQERPDPSPLPQADQRHRRPGLPFGQLGPSLVPRPPAGARPRPSPGSWSRWPCRRPGDRAIAGFDELSGALEVLGRVESPRSARHSIVRSSSTRRRRTGARDGRPSMSLTNAGSSRIGSKAGSSSIPPKSASPPGPRPRAVGGRGPRAVGPSPGRAGHRLRGHGEGAGGLVAEVGVVGVASRSPRPGPGSAVRAPRPAPRPRSPPRTAWSRPAARIVWNLSPGPPGPLASGRAGPRRWPGRGGSRRRRWPVPIRTFRSSRAFAGSPSLRFALARDLMASRLPGLRRRVVAARSRDRLDPLAPRPRAARSSPTETSIEDLVAPLLADRREVPPRRGPAPPRRPSRRR